MHARFFTFIVILAGSMSAQAEHDAAAVLDPTTLTFLETNGLGISSTFPGGSKSDRALDLNRNSIYSTIAESLNQDLEGAKKKDPRLSVTMNTAHRLFNIKWLSSPAALFELAGIVNRLDRIPFDPQHCGEIRLIYRLAYDMKDRGQSIHSRLPFTLNLVYLAARDRDGGCREAARRWLQFQDHLAARDAANARKSLRLETAQLKSIEVNMQSVRWPSTTRGDLGAHAEYLLRVFNVEKNKAVLAPLENTPAFERIARNPTQREKLKQWVKANIKAIDEGTATAPEFFLARKVTSVSPRGLTRRANRPWSAIFTPEDFSDIDFASTSYLKSPEAVLRRLDDSSCSGCHQNRSVAGFHLLGVDREGTSPFNAIAVPGSPHFINDQPRRAAYIKAVHTGKPASDFRPLSERAVAEDGAHGAHCGLGDPGFKNWTCRPGLICQPYGLEQGDKTVGQCFSAGAPAAVGEPCETGYMIGHSDPHKDRVRQNKETSCGTGGVCETNYVGFPEGMCAVSCGSSTDNMHCGRIALLVGFNRCLGKGQPFPKCLDENTRPTGLRACSLESPCRDDYICSGLSGKTGTCIPPYFLFQMRVDGHPRPPT